MNLTGTEVRVGMTAAANVSSVNTTGSVTIGTPVAALVYDSAPDTAYSLRMEIANDEVLSLNMENGEVLGTTSGVLQVETATVIAAAGATAAGDATVIVTAANLVGSPLTISVPLLLTDNTATLVATKIRNAIESSSVAGQFTIGGTGANISLTARSRISNDATLNISIANGTCAGITAAPTSTNTTAGIPDTQAYRISGAVWDETDFEGQLLPTSMVMNNSFLLKVNSGTVTVTNGSNTFVMESGNSFLVFSPYWGTFMFGTSLSFWASSGDASLTIDIHASV
jgi:hypothetical protein